jgi:hypothetical protein
MELKNPQQLFVQKLIYVYEADTTPPINIGVFSTVECAKHFKMGKDTLTKYLNSKLPFFSPPPQNWGASRFALRASRFALRSQGGVWKNIFTCKFRLNFYASMV